MAKDYLSDFLPDLKAFEDKIMAFDREEVTVGDYKGFSGGYGSYAQRGAKKHMLRLRMAGGRLTKSKLKYIVDTCEQYHINKLKITTCQSIQMHDLDAKDVPSIMKSAWEAGMISRGGGGDFPRNVMASPLSGVQTDEYFDITPYANAAGEYLMAFIKGPKFPRKLKVGFSNSPENRTHATFRDLGFVANKDNTFDVYAAGGLGNKPLLGVLVAEGIAPCKILYYIKAMVNTFITYGNYENRAKARTRFMQETLGIEGFKKAYLEKLDEVMKSEQLDIEVTPTTCSKSADGNLEASTRIIPQKQNGLYAVFYQPVGGNLLPSKAAELYRVMEPMEDVEIRLTPEEGLYIINCTAKEAEAVLAVTNDGAANLFETSSCCVGAATCQVGIGNSPALLNACIEAVRKENFADGVLPRIQISGCPSSCAAHQVAAIGFRGGMKPSSDGPKPAFAIFLGGNDYQGVEKIADMGKSLFADEIPAFLVELGKMIAAENMTYEQWIVNNQDKLDALVAKYTE